MKNVTLPETRAERHFARFRQSEDPRDLAAVFDLTAPELMRVAVYLVRDEQTAEDLLQETFLTAIERRESFHGGRALLPKAYFVSRRTTGHNSSPTKLMGMGSISGYPISIGSRSFGQYTVPNSQSQQLSTMPKFFATPPSSVAS